MRFGWFWITPASIRRADATADKDGHVFETTLIENPPHASGERHQVTAVDPHPTDGNSKRTQQGSQGHDLSGRHFRVVGITINSMRSFGLARAKASNAAVSSSNDWMNECAIVP